MKTKILVIEDEVKIARFLELELTHEGYEVTLAHDGRQGYKQAALGEADLIILDLMLPGLSGIEVCRRLRRSLNTPIIMLTAKDDVIDKVVGLDSGADDYMTKPFAIEELLARMRTVLKRQENKLPPLKCIRVGELVIFPEQYRVTYQEEDIILSKTEFALLKYLMENQGIVLSREKILNRVWGYDYLGDTNIIDVYIRYLRNKIDQKYQKSFIHTVRGVGYMLKNDEQ